MLLNVAATKAIKGGAKPLDSRKQKSSLNNTIFRIVTSGLYIRPIEAIVRELCTNALDGHIAVDKADVPFDVHLPNVLEPYFIVRDYGSSMSKDTIFDIYGVLGESTKNSSSKEIGGWGVGGKSPYAYTDTFFITTYLDGLKRIYQGSALAEESPLELILEIPSDEPQGVEVKVPVQEKDFSRFQSAAETQLEPFFVKPNISGVSDFEYSYGLASAHIEKFEVNLYLPNEDGSSLILRKQEVNAVVNSKYPHDFAIQMGCVIYPINSTAENYAEFKEVLSKINTLSGKASFIFQLPVDSVDIKPSREDLDYTERTNKVLSNIIDKIYSVCFKDFILTKRKLRQLSYEDAIKYLVENTNTTFMQYYVKEVKHYHPVLERYISFCLYQTTLKQQKIKELSSYFRNKNASFVGALPKKGKPPFYSIDNFKIVTSVDEKAKNFKDVFYCFAPFQKNQTITVFLKAPTYIKKVKQYLEDNPDTLTGLYNRTSYNFLEQYEINLDSEWGKKRTLNNAALPTVRSNAALCLTKEELAFITPFLEDIYGKVNVIDVKTLTLPTDPKETKKRAVPDTQLDYSCDYISKDKVVTNVTSYINVGYSYKEFDFFLEELSKELDYCANIKDYEIVLYSRGEDPSRCLVGDYRTLCNFLLLQKRNVVFVAAPPAFTERLLNSNKYLLTSLDSFKADLLGKISPKAKSTMVATHYKTLVWQAFLDNLDDMQWRSRPSTLTKNAAKLAEKVIANPILEKHFYSFLVKEKPRVLKYPALASYLYHLEKSKTPQTYNLWREHDATRLTNRVIYRMEVLLKKRKMLNLIFACDDFSHRNSTGITMHQYFQHILKGVPDDNTETSTN